MKTKLLILIVIVVFITSCSKINTGKDVLILMKEKYKNSHIMNMTFSQHVKEFSDDSLTNKTIWHEAYSSPGNLIIKMDSFNSGSGYVFNQDSLYILNNNKVDLKIKELNILAILGFDVYSIDVKKTSDKLLELGYNLDKVCETRLNNRDVYCIGVYDESEESNKFYIDKENLYFIKYITYSENGVTEGEFSNYKVIKGYNVATKVLFYHNNKLVMSEEYYDIKFPKEIDSEIFNAYRFQEASW